MNGLSARKKVLAVIAAMTALVLVALGLAQGAAARNNVGAPVGQSSTTGHTIAVQGHGQASVAPDMATMTLGVTSHDSTASVALSANGARMNDVIAAVRAQGIPDSHIQTSNLSIYFDAQHDYYVVTHEITVKLDNTSRVGAVLDAAVGAGANTSWGVSFGLKDPSMARSQALKDAVTDARKRADSMAVALGLTISGVGSAEETSYSYQPIAYANQSLKAPSPASTNVQPGELSVTADIKVVYTFA
ncbi:MAG: SIMPL domain-containing protein [Chloroflexota bacterium]